MSYRSIFFALSCLLFTGCEETQDKLPGLRSELALPKTVVATPLDLPEAIDLTASEQEVPSRVINVSDSKVWPDCHTQLEINGKPRDSLYITDEAEHAEMLWGCGIEASTRGEDGERYYAYGLATQDRLRASDQRISAYDKEGKLLWHHTIDRDSDELNFASSRRSSFVVDIPPYLVCGGTRWEGSLDYVCAQKQKQGEVAWKGKLSQWSGTNPVAHAKSLTFGDISKLKKVYPWEGVERTSAPLDGTGGYSAVYVTDGDTYIMSSNRVPWKTLTAYDLDTMAPSWKRSFEDAFDPLWTHAFEQFDMTLLRQNSTLIAIKTSTGETLWRLKPGEEAPPIAASDKEIYLLLRRATGPNLIYAIDPKTGKPLWYGAPPTGTLKIAYNSGTLLLKSIKSVQRAWTTKPDK